MKMAMEQIQQGEEAEDQAFDQIMQICQQAGQTGDPKGYQQIMQIIQGLEQHNQEEEAELGGGEGEGASNDMAARVMERIKKGKAQGGQNA